MLRQLLIDMLEHVREIDRKIDVMEEALIRQWHRHSEASQRLAEIPGIGLLTATALIGHIGTYARVAEITTEGRFARGEMHPHQPTGRIIHVHQQRALRGGVFEPAMLTPVDLDQLTQIGPAGTRLINPGRALTARDPQARRTHPTPYRFLAQPNAVTLLKLLARQRRTKIGIVLAHQRHRLCTKIDRQLAIARLAAFARNQTRSTTRFIAPAQAADLAHTQVQPLGRLITTQPAFDDCLDELDPFQFAHACHDQSTFVDDRLLDDASRQHAPQSLNRTFLSRNKLCVCQSEMALCQIECGVGCERLQRVATGWLRLFRISLCFRLFLVSLIRIIFFLKETREIHERLRNSSITTFSRRDRDRT